MLRFLKLRKPKISSCYTTSREMCDKTTLSLYSFSKSSHTPSMLRFLKLRKPKISSCYTTSVRMCDKTTLSLRFIKNWGCSTFCCSTPLSFSLAVPMSAYPLARIYSRGRAVEVLRLCGRALVLCERRCRTPWLSVPRCLHDG